MSEEKVYIINGLFICDNVLEAKDLDITMKIAPDSFVENDYGSCDIKEIIGDD
jgi:hypothetical protein